ncbi:MAG TPA: hypothetical protein VKO85_00355 [Wenzhouxiangellaceae bacterium]|nr:hypothetical protein [Wenzhouxiangellaceae bacterium]
MSGKEDEPDLERFADRDTSRDEFSMGPTEDQIRHAEQMLGSFNAPTYVEKRDLAEDYRPGSLQPMDRSAEPVKVLVSSHPASGQEYYVVLSEAALSAIRAAEITTRRLGQLQTRTGRLEPGHEGRRAEDKQNGTLMVSFFYPVE